MRSTKSTWKYAGGIASALIVVATLTGACQRRRAEGGSSAAAAAVADGCLETNPGADIAAACQTCLRKHGTDNPAGDGCCGIGDAIGSQLCHAVAACMRGADCNLAGDTTTCFCGTNQSVCDVPGQANGPCVAPIAAAAGRNIATLATDRPTASQILDRYGDVKYALGRASNIASIAGAFCKAECTIGR